MKGDFCFCFLRSSCPVRRTALEQVIHEYPFEKKCVHRLGEMFCPCPTVLRHCEELKTILRSVVNKTKEFYLHCMHSGRFCIAQEVWQSKRGLPGTINYM